MNRLLNKKNIGFGIILVFFALNFHSCIGMKKNASKKSKSYYETFYINDSTLQYFIKPIEFKGNSAISIDFTFRKTNLEFSNVVVNFSIFSEKKLNITDFKLIADKKQYHLKQIDLLYKEKKKDKYIYRYTSELEYDKTETFFNSTISTINLTNSHLLPTNKSKKAIKLLKNDFFGFILED